MLRTLFAILCVMTVSGAATAQLGAPPLPEKSLGDPKAPIRIDEYFSQDCPHCAAFDMETLPQLKANYLDKGKARLVVHEYPLSEIALRASMLARCADPDRYFPMVDTLFRTQRAWVLETPAASLEALRQQAKLAGLTDAKIAACLGNQGLETALLQGRLEAESKVDIEVTPTFTFNGDVSDRFDGAAPYDEFVKKMAELGKK